MIGRQEPGRFAVLGRVLSKIMSGKWAFMSEVLSKTWFNLAL
jgi:hypothetical protein